MAPMKGRLKVAQQGWYSDPLDQTRQRFWSGNQWLDFTRDPRHPAKLVKRLCPDDAPPPTIEPWWRIAMMKVVIPAVCALVTSSLLAALISSQQGPEQGPQGPWPIVVETPEPADLPANNEVVVP